MLKAGRKFADRVWAVGGCNGVGRHIAHRLVASGETVLDVPAKLSAQVRVFATGNGLSMRGGCLVGRPYTGESEAQQGTASAAASRQGHAGCS